MTRLLLDDVIGSSLLKLCSRCVGFLALFFSLCCVAMRGRESGNANVFGPHSDL